MYRCGSARRQRGAALVIALIFLLLTTLLSTSSMQTATVQERMAGNMRDWHMGFQGAEAALRSAEEFLRNTVVLPEFDDQDGYYQVNSPQRPQWSGAASSDGNGYIHYPHEISGAGRQPRYFIERLSSIRPAGADTETGKPVDEVFFFRVTAVGYGGALDDDGEPLTSVVLSSVYRSR